MSEHDEMLKKAGVLAVYLDYVNKDGAAHVRTLATTIERQDAVIAETTAACVTCDKVIREFRTYYPSRSRSLWEKLHAAGHLAGNAAKLGEAKGDVEKTLAASGDRASPTPPDWDRYHELLDIMAGKGGLLSPSEQAEYDRFLPIIAALDVEEGKAADVGLDELCKKHLRTIASIQRLTTAVLAESKPPPPVGGQGMPTPPGYSGSAPRLDDAIDSEEAKLARQGVGYTPKPRRSGVTTPAITDDKTKLQELWQHLIYEHNPPSMHWDWFKPRLEALQQAAEAKPPPPVKVEMRVTQGNRHLWEARIGDLWITAAPGTNYRFSSAALAQETGNAWLAALGKKLGVPLEAVWKNGE